MRAALALTLAQALVLAACAPQPSEMRTAAAFKALATPLEFPVTWTPARAWRGDGGNQQFYFYDLVSSRPPRTAQVRMQFMLPKEGLEAPLAPLASAADGAREIARAHGTPVPAGTPVVEIRNTQGVAYVQFGPQGPLWCGWAVQHFDGSRGARASSCGNGSALSVQTQVREDLREVLAGLRLRT